MNKWGLTAGACVLALVGGLAAQTAGTQKKAAGDAKLERGKYLVEKIGMCNDCHTPMTPQGPDISKRLQGAELIFKPTVPVPNWVERSANIAGMKGWTEAEAVKFLTTGIDPNGKTARPPMPEYRYNKSDAQAVYTYLRSLGEPASGSAK